jgi:hypothetical protein
MSELYAIDVFAWSARQADLLRRVAAGERVADNDMDWPNIVEEIESVGRSELRSVESHLIQALLHDLKAEAWPLASYVPHWRAEARGQRADARRAFAPSMRQKIDVADLYRDALARLPDSIDGLAPLPVDIVCPFSTIDELLTGEAGVDHAE